MVRCEKCGRLTGWDGWGTALKPAVEPIILARKPFKGTVASNVLEHGTGGLNVDGCRVGADGETIQRGEMDAALVSSHLGYQRPGKSMMTHKPKERSGPANTLGRFPANLIHDGSDEVVGLFPVVSPSPKATRQKNSNAPQTSNAYGQYSDEGRVINGHGDSGSAARFFYCAKASKKDRGDGNNHPTVKPTDLMRYLCRLTTPPGGIVLDPFAGSGSTGKAAKAEGFGFIGIEKQAEYAEIARQRIGGAA